MTSPEVATGVAALIAARFAATPDPAAPPQGPAVVAVDVAAVRVDGDWFVEQLAAAMGSSVVPASTVGEPERRCVVRLDAEIPPPSAGRGARRRAPAA